MRMLPRETILSLSALAIVFALGVGTSFAGTSDSPESALVLLRNGGRLAGITPQTGGRIVLYRTDTGKNVLDARPELWGDLPPANLGDRPWKEYFGESVWPGPAVDWWTNREPYPPKGASDTAPSGHWPPDPAWEMAAYKVVENSGTRVVMQSPVSALTGLQLTKTVELLANGKLRLHVTARNCGYRIVTRDLWMLTRVPLSTESAVPFTSTTTEKNFSAAASSRMVDGLTVMKAKSGPGTGPPYTGKLLGHAKAGWMAAVTENEFFIIRFSLTPPAKVAASEAPVEVFYSTPPFPLCELEHHGPLTAILPGKQIDAEETWEIVPRRQIGDGVASDEPLSALLKSFAKEHR